MSFSPNSFEMSIYFGSSWWAEHDVTPLAHGARQFKSEKLIPPLPRTRNMTELVSPNDITTSISCHSHNMKEINLS